MGQKKIFRNISQTAITLHLVSCVFTVMQTKKRKLLKECHCLRLEKGSSELELLSDVKIL